MPLGPMRTKAQKQAGMGEVMGEFKRGKLRSGSKTGPQVTSRKQAIAIGLSQTGQSRYAEGGIVEHHDDPDLPPLQDEARLEQQIHYPPEYLQTMDLLQRQAREMNSGDGYRPSNFFYRPDRERPAAPSGRPIALPYPRRRFRRRAQDGDIEELFDHSSRYQGGGGVRHLDDGGGCGGEGSGEGSGAAGGGGCGSCGVGGGCGCSGSGCGGCGCQGDSCGGGACGACSCGQGSGSGVGVGAGAGAAGGCSDAGDAAGAAGAFGGGAFGAGLGGMGGFAGAAEAAGMAAAAEGDTGGGKGGAMGVGLGAWGGLAGGPTGWGGPAAGVTGDPTGNLGAVAGPAPGANPGIAAAMGPGFAAHGMASTAAEAYAGGPFSGAALGTAHGAETGGFFGANAGLGYSGTGLAGTGAFGAEGDAGGGQTSGIGNAGASFGAGFGGTSGYASSGIGNTIAAGLAGPDDGGGKGGVDQGGGKGGVGGIGWGGGPAFGGVQADVSSIAGVGPGSGGWGQGETGIGNVGAAAVGGFGGVSDTAASTADAGNAGGSTDTAAADVGAAPAAADTAVAAAAQDNTPAASQDETTGQGGKGGGRSAAAEPAAPASVTATPAGPGAFSTTGLDAMDAAAQGMPGGMAAVGNIGAESLGATPGGGGWGTGVGGVGNQGASIGLGAAPGAFADLAGPGPAAADVTTAQEATPDPGPDARGAFSFGLGPQGLAPAANAIANTIGGWMGNLGYTGVAHGEPAPAITGMPAWSGVGDNVGGFATGFGDQGWGFGISGATAGPTGTAGLGLGVAPGTTVGGLTETGTLTGDPTGYTGNYGNTGKGGGPGAFGTGWTGIGSTQGGQMGAVAAPGLAGPSGMQGGMNPGTVGAIGEGWGIASGAPGTGGWSAGIGDMGVAGPGLGLAEGETPAANAVTEALAADVQGRGGPPPAGPFGNPGTFGPSFAPSTAVTDIAATEQTDPTTNPTFGPQADPFSAVTTTPANPDPGFEAPTGNRGSITSEPLGDLELAGPTTDQTTGATTNTVGEPGDFGYGIGSSGLSDEGYGPGYGGPEDTPAPAPAPAYGGSKSAGLGLDLGSMLGVTTAQAQTLSADRDQAVAAAALAAESKAAADRAGSLSTANAQNTTGLVGGFADQTDLSPSPTPGAVLGGPSFSLGDPSYGLGTSLAAAPGDLSNYGPNTSAQQSLDAAFSTDFGGRTGGPATPGDMEALDAAHGGNKGGAFDVQAGKDFAAQVAQDARTAALENQTVSQAPYAALDTLSKGDRGIATPGLAASLDQQALDAQALGEQGRGAAAKGDRDMTAQDRAAPVGTVTSEPLAAARGDRDMTAEDRAAPVSPVTNTPLSAIDVAFATPGSLAPADLSTPDPGALSSRGSIATALDPGGLGGPTPGGFAGTVTSAPMAGYPGGFVGAAPTAGPQAEGYSPSVTTGATPTGEPTGWADTLGSQYTGGLASQAIDALNTPTAQTVDRSTKGDLETQEQAQERAAPVTPVTQTPLPNIQPPPPLQGRVGGKDALLDMLGLNPQTVDRTGKGDMEQTVDRTGKTDLTPAPTVPDVVPDIPTPTPDPRGRTGTPTTPTTTTPTPGPGPAPGLGPTPGPVGGLGGRAGAGMSVSEMGGEWQPAVTERVQQQVQRDPASFAGMMSAAPGILAGLEQNFSPQQIDQMFGSIGFSRKEQNPAPPDESGTLKVEQPQQGFGGVQMAQGGLVDHPGFYAAGGLSPASMRSYASTAHYSGANIKPALNPPGVHLINSSEVAGRTDRIPMRARTGSFVLPADVVSGLGQGNTNAGAKMWGQMISHSIGPMGIQNAIRQRTLKAPALRGFGGRSSGTKGFADGGEVDDLTPIVTAGGEALIDPEIVCQLGGGDPDRGKKVLIDSVMTVRGHVIKHLKKLPRPEP